MEVELLKFGQSLEVGQVFELVVDGDENTKSGVTGPALIDLLKLVPRNVQIVKFWAFETGPFVELVVGNVEPLEICEALLSGEN